MGKLSVMNVFNKWRGVAEAGIKGRDMYLYPTLFVGWPWYLDGLDTSDGFDTWAQSEYKDRLYQVWGFPC